MSTTGTSSSSGRVKAIATQVGANPNEFRYTLPNDLLTVAQRKEYEENGFIVIKKLLSEDKIDRWAARFKELCEQPAQRPVSMTVMRDVALAKKMNATQVNDENVTTKIQDFHDDPVMFTYCQDPQLLKYVECFTGPKIVASHTMLINKPTDQGTGTSRHPLHQDMLYFPFRPADRIVAAWTAMEKVTRENGCLVAVPGSHKTEILEHGYPDWAGGVNAAYVGIMGVSPEVKYVHLEMEKGDTVFFHPLLWHGSGRNQTPRFRKAISCHFGSGDCRFIDVKGTIQEELEEEVKQIAKVKFSRLGDMVTDEMLATFRMADLWEMKSRVVQGDQMYLPIEETK